MQTVPAGVASLQGGRAATLTAAVTDSVTAAVSVFPPTITDTLTPPVAILALVVSATASTSTVAVSARMALTVIASDWRLCRCRRPAPSISFPPW